MTARVVFFDVSGVLVNWDAVPLFTRIFSGDKARMRHFFEAVLDAQQLSRIATGTPTLTVLGEIEQRHPEFAAALNAWWTQWDTMVSDDFPETVEIARQLKGNGHTTCVLGNWARDEFDRAAARFDFLGDFDHIVISGDHGVMKPDSRIFEIALKRCQATPEQAVFIDDTQKNVDGAEKLGIHAIHFTDARALREELQGIGLLDD